MQIRRIHFRGILESRGKLTVEAELELTDGSIGIASAPVAIAPGRREQRRSHICTLGPLDCEAEFAQLRNELENGRFDAQRQFDEFLEQLPIALRLGADVKLVLSVAFCRASANARGESLLQHLIRLGEAKASIPRPLVNIFSGGIHDFEHQQPFQQIMFAPNFGNIRANIEAALAVYGEMERRLTELNKQFVYSASSGIMVSNASYLDLFNQLNAVLSRLHYLESQSRLAVDVAAEHLRAENGLYLFGKRDLQGPELLQQLLDLVRTYNIELVEDPFDSFDAGLWRTLTQELCPSALVIGDDLFASNSANIQPGLASGILLKLNQIGTISGALNAVQKSRQMGLAICVSHRSGETEDTVMCDFAVAIGASYIKIGGPRRGDRIAKYNRLLLLSEQLLVAENLGAEAGNAPTHPKRGPLVTR